MKHRNTITIIVVLIVVFAAAATLCGIFSSGGPGRYEYESIRGRTVVIYGEGIYKDMSADVAVQGIAQDYVTLIVGIPLLLVAFNFARKNSLRGQFLLSGVLGYFLVTYLFYTAMGMYNALFLVYVFLLAATFFAFVLSLFSFDISMVQQIFESSKAVRAAGFFLMLDAVAVGVLWLGVVVPPLLEGTIVPDQAQHYTTLIVQGFDLGLLLPISFVVGMLAIRRNPYGYLFTTIYVVFLSLMMAALVSKILFMAREGQNVLPVIFIMPSICAISILFSFLLLRQAEAPAVQESMQR
ncbi:MAG: hypothetical protein GF401_05010 [Chitinivibrionales bacterium]|nr:hypothetical protein [Chitinivibrionales bacterium]